MSAVLVVDDDPDLLRYIVMTLTRSGVKAIEARTGEEALRIFHQRRDEICMLLTDVLMPQGSGIELCAAVEALDPNFKVVFMTGYKNRHVEQFGDALDGHEILGKPFTAPELIQFVGRVLQSTAAAGC